MIQIIIIDDTSTVISEFNVTADMNGETDPIKLSDAVKDTLSMKYEIEETD